jgi:hypothetical protein
MAVLSNAHGSSVELSSTALDTVPGSLSSSNEHNLKCFMLVFHKLLMVF